MLAHGASVSVAFALRRERNLERIRALLDLSSGSFNVMYLSLLPRPTSSVRQAAHRGRNLP